MQCRVPVVRKENCVPPLVHWNSEDVSSLFAIKFLMFGLVHFTSILVDMLATPECCEFALVGTLSGFFSRAGRRNDQSPLAMTHKASNGHDSRWQFCKFSGKRKERPTRCRTFHCGVALFQVSLVTGTGSCHSLSFLKPCWRRGYQASLAGGM